MELKNNNSHKLLRWTHIHESRAITILWKNSRLLSYYKTTIHSEDIHIHRHKETEWLKYDLLAQLTAWLTRNKNRNKNMNSVPSSM